MSRLANQQRKKKMLNIKNFEEIKDDNIKDLLAKLRPLHISRFPIDVEVGSDGYKIKFMDSRFPHDHWRYKDSALEASVGYLWREGYDKNGEPVYKLYSRLIQNNRYSTYNDDYHTRTTNDLKKMLKYMRESLKPFSALEIAVRTLNKANGNFSEWQVKPRLESANTVRHLGTEDLLEIFRLQKAQGVAPVNDKVVAIYEKGLPADELYKERANVTPARIHIFINPDSTVQVTMFNDQSFTLYDSMETVPENLRQQIAMLQISDNGNHIGSIGTKMTDREFWVDTL